MTTLSQTDQALKNRNLAFTLGKIGAGIITPFAPYVGLPLYAGLQAGQVLTDEKKKKEYDIKNLGMDLIDTATNVVGVGVAGQLAKGALKPLAATAIKTGVGMVGDLGKEYIAKGNDIRADSLLNTGLNGLQDFGMNAIPQIASAKMNVPKGVKAPDLGFGEVPKGKEGLAIPNIAEYKHSNGGVKVELEAGEIAIPGDKLNLILSGDSLAKIGENFIKVTNDIKAKGIPSNNEAEKGAFNKGLLTQTLNNVNKTNPEKIDFFKQVQHDNLNTTLDNIPYQIPEEEKTVDIPLEKTASYYQQPVIPVPKQFQVQNSISTNKTSNVDNVEPEQNSFMTDYWEGLDNTEKWNIGLNATKGLLSAGLLARSLTRDKSTNATAEKISTPILQNPTTATKAATDIATNKTYTTLLENMKRAGAQDQVGALAGTLFEQKRKAAVEGALADVQSQNQQASINYQTDVANAQTANQVEQYNIQKQLQENLGISQEIAGALSGMFKSATEYQNFKLAMDQKKITGTMLENIISTHGPKDGWALISQTLFGGNNLYTQAE